MVSRESHCQRNRLKALLEGDTADAGQADVLRHLERCEACRQELERLAGDPKWWAQARRFLGSAEDEPTERSDARHGTPFAPGSVEDDVPSYDDVVLSFLSPSDNPAMLGRLDKYDVVEVIGRGGMGIVFRAFDAQLNRYVAIKVIAPHWASSATSRRRFAREAQAAAAVVHHNVMPIHGVGSLGNLPYLVMPYVLGRSLQARIDQSGPLPTIDVLRVGVQTAAGLAAAHAQGLVHRDIKPGNILLENSVERVLITDFGLARAVDDASLTMTGLIAGTPHYMSPEQAAGETVDYRSDLFSLGSVLYATCTGRPPFRAPTTMGVLHRICHASHRAVREVQSEVPAKLADVIDTLLSKDPADRLQSAAETAHVLEELLAELQQPPRAKAHDAAGRSAMARPRDARPQRRLKSWKRWSLAVVAVGLAVGVLAGLLVLSGDDPHPDRTRSPVATGGQQAPAPVADDPAEGAKHAAPPQRPVAGPLGQQWSFNFRQRRFDPDILIPTGVNSLYAASSIVPEPEGLRVTILRGQAGHKPRLGFAPAYEIHGDFEITASYEILSQEPPGSEALPGANVRILARDGLASASLRRCSRLGQEPVYLVSCTMSGELENRSTPAAFYPATGRSGKLRLARSGDVLRFLVAEENEDEFNELHQVEFGSMPIGLLEIEAFAEHAQGTLDVRWNDVTIGAKELRAVDLPLRRSP